MVQITSVKNQRPKLGPQSGLEDYIERFSIRYDTEKRFRRAVNSYMRLKPARRFRIGISRLIAKPKYETRRTGLITEYAMKVLPDLEEVIALQTEITELEQAEHNAQVQQETHKKATAAIAQVQAELSSVAETRQQEIGHLNIVYSKKAEEAKTQMLAEKQEIIDNLDPKRLAQTHLIAKLKQSSLLSEDEHGNLDFDEQMLVKALEELFLADIVKGIEQKTGRKGAFMGDLKRAYQEVVTHYDQIMSMGEMRRVNWPLSIIYSRTKGYSLPTFPYLISAKTQPVTRAGQLSVPVAISIDRSNSMNHNDRMTIAKKASMATVAALRKADSKAPVMLSAFDSTLEEMSSLQVWKTLKPSGWTHTYLALDWLLNSLGKYEGPSMAYLFTDGYPEGENGQEYQTDMAIKAAKRFSDYPNVRLRIFLIDGDNQTKSIIRRIGNAAGPSTAVIPLSNYELEEGMIRNVKDTLHQMYEIGNF
jgi:hypothetical protein